MRKVGREDDVHHVLPRRNHRLRRDRVDDRNGPLELHVGLDPELLAQLTTQRLDECLATVDAASRQQPILLPRLLLTAEEHPPLPAEDRADPDPWLRQCPVDPKPSAPRSPAGSSSTSTISTGGT